MPSAVGGTWRVTAQVVRETMDSIGSIWTSSIGTPMFELDGEYLGIVSEEHCESIARRIVDPLNCAKEVHISAVRIGD